MPPPRSTAAAPTGRTAVAPRGVGRAPLAEHNALVLPTAAHRSGAAVGGDENEPPAHPHAEQRDAFQEEDEAGAGCVLPVQKLSATALQMFSKAGRHAGGLATTAACKGEPITFSAPADVCAAGPAAVQAWQLGFLETFKEQEPLSPASVLVTAIKKRKSSAVVSEPVSGRAGLESSAAKAELSLCVYAHVRSCLFLPKDDCKSAVSAWLMDKGYSYAEDEYNSWWNTFGHSAAVKKAISARASTVLRIKESIWKTYSACALQPTFDLAILTLSLAQLAECRQ